MACENNLNAAATGGARNGITKLASKAAYGAGAGLSTWAGWNAGATVGGLMGAGYSGYVSGGNPKVTTTGALVGTVAGGTIGAIKARRAFDNAVTSRRRKAEAKAWKNRNIEAENRHIAEAKAQGRFYDNLNRRTTSTKYIVAGVIEGDQFKGPQGQPTVDKLEFYDKEEAMSLAFGAGYSLWKVTANRNASPTSSSSQNTELKESLLLEQVKKANYQSSNYDMLAGEYLTDDFHGMRVGVDSLRTVAGQNSQVQPILKMGGEDDIFRMQGSNGHIYYSMPDDKKAQIEAVVPRQGRGAIMSKTLDNLCGESDVTPTDTFSYNITNMETGETFISSEEPYGRRPEPDSSGGTMMEVERPEADQFHEIVDTRSNRVELE